MESESEDSSMPPKKRQLPTVHPTILLHAKLNASCTAVTAAVSPFEDDRHNANLCYVIYGKNNGETIVASDDQCIQQTIAFEPACPITVVVTGDGRNIDTSEIFIIAANGHMRSYTFPKCTERGVPACYVPGECQFEQLLNANISFAEILDIDSDDRKELLVAMTDRVVRSYRYEDVDDDDTQPSFVPLSKWEVPSHISGISVGFDIGLTILLTQVHHQQYIRINLTNETVKVVQPMITETNDGSRKRATYQLVVPPKPLRVTILNSIATRVFVANTACNSEIVLKTDKTTVVGAAATVLGSGLRIVVIVDRNGLLSAYGWMDHLIPKTEPFTRCRIPQSPDRICALADPANPHGLLLGVSYLDEKLNFLKLDFKNVIPKSLK